MFAYINKNGVRSSEGFEVQSVDRFTIEYRERGKRISVYVEPGKVGDKYAEIISHDAFQNWDDEKSDERLSQSEQARILANFRAALEFQGLLLVVNE